MVGPSTVRRNGHALFTPRCPCGGLCRRDPARAGWDPPAGTIAFHQKTFDDSDSQIYLARADGTSGAVALTTQASAPNPSACWNGGCGAEFPDWAPDGSRVYFDSSWTPFIHIWSLASDGSGPVMEPPVRDFDGLPGISADGTLIAWDGGNEDNSLQGIYLRTLGSPTATELTTGPSDGYDSSPDISPDNSRVVFTRFHNSGTRVEIWSVNTDGTGLRRLLSGGRRWGDPHYSPDGSRILVKLMTSSPTRAGTPTSPDPARRRATCDR